MQSQEIIEQQVKVWSSKIKAKGLASSDPGARRETEFRLQQMLKELEIKQKQLLKLLQSRDMAEEKKNLALNRQALSGKLDETQELLNLFAREAKEDTKDIRHELKSATLQIDKLDQTLRQQSNQLSSLQRDQLELNSKLRHVTLAYRQRTGDNYSENPLVKQNLMKTDEQRVNDEIFE